MESEISHKRQSARADHRQAIGEFVLTRSRLRPGVAPLFSALALALGVLADVLGRDARLGVNIPLWDGALVAALLIAARVSATPIRQRWLVLFCASALLAAMVGWRASTTLQLLDIAGASMLLVLGLAAPPAIGLRRISFAAFCLALAVGLVSIGIGGFRLAHSLRWHRRLSAATKDRARSVGRAVVIAFPLLLGFGGLFVAADAVFETQVRSILSINLGDLGPHLFWLLGGAWLAAGVLWCAFGFESLDNPAVQLPATWRLKSPEVAIVLGSLAVLFALFVAVQVRYLFGGESLVQRSINLTYAEYARRGFFELVAASVLLLPVLVAVHWARARNRSSTVVFRGLAVLLVSLLFVVMASALWRLHIYEHAYGLTAARLYPVVVLIWLALVFLWFLGTLFVNRSEEFILGAVTAAALLLTVLNLVSPDALIARTNTHRLLVSESFDAAHAAGLSADAVPTLLRHLDQMSSSDRCVVSQALLREYTKTSPDWQSWNWSRHEASSQVSRQRAQLETACN